MSTENIKTVNDTDIMVCDHDERIESLMNRYLIAKTRLYCENNNYNETIRLVYLTGRLKSQISKLLSSRYNNAK